MSLDKKNIFWNTLGSGINAFNSLFLMIIVTRINGIEDAGIFTYAYAISFLFNIICAYSGRVYQLTDNSKLTDSDYLFCKCITLVLTFFSGIVFVLANGYDSYKSFAIILLIIYRSLDAFSECIYAYYQKNDELYKVGISLFIKNLIILILFLLSDLLFKNLILSIIVIICVYSLIMIFYDFKILKEKKIKLNFISKDKIIYFFVSGFSTFILIFLVNLLNNIPRYIIDYKLTNELNTIWGIIIMPATVMSLICQFILHPFLMKLHSLYSAKKYNEYCKMVTKLCLVLLVFGIAVVLVGGIIGIPFLEIIYGISLSEYTLALVIILIGSVFSAIATCLYNILVADRVLKTQIILYLSFCLILAILDIVLINKYNIYGACYAYGIVMLFSLVSYVIVFALYINKMKKLGGKNEVRSSISNI